MKSSSKILITGSTGFLGLRLVYKLLEKKETDLRCFVRPTSNFVKIELLQDVFPKAHIEIFQGNLTNQKDAQKAVQDVDVIYNCAAAKNGPFASMYLNTVVGTKNLLESVAKQISIRRFVHISSFAVYGTGNLPRATVINEMTPLEEHLKRRDDAYTYTKLKQEQLVWRYSSFYNLPVIVVRPGVVYGPRGDAISRRVGLKLLGYFLNIGGNNILPLSYVDNCADAIILAGTVPGIEGQAFNIHDSDLCTCNEFLSLYRKKVNKMKAIKVPYSLFWLFSWFIQKYSLHSKGQIPAVLHPYRTASTWKGCRFNNSKLIEMLGWRQQVATKEGLEKHFRYCRQLQRAGKA